MWASEEDVDWEQSRGPPVELGLLSWHCHLPEHVGVDSDSLAEDDGISVGAGGVGLTRHRISLYVVLSLPSTFALDVLLFFVHRDKYAPQIKRLTIVLNFRVFCSKPRILLPRSLVRIIQNLPRKWSKGEIQTRNHCHEIHEVPTNNRPTCRALHSTGYPRLRAV